MSFAIPVENDNVSFFGCLATLGKHVCLLDIEGRILFEKR